MEAKDLIELNEYYRNLYGKEIAILKKRVSELRREQTVQPIAKPLDCELEQVRKAAEAAGAETEAGPPYDKPKAVATYNTEGLSPFDVRESKDYSPDERKEIRLALDREGVEYNNKLGTKALAKLANQVGAKALVGSGGAISVSEKTVTVYKDDTEGEGEDAGKDSAEVGVATKAKVVTNVEVVTEEAIRSACTAIVQAHPAARDVIKGIIASEGDAKTQLIADVPPSNRHRLLARLDKMLDHYNRQEGI